MIPMECFVCGKKILRCTKKRPGMFAGTLCPNCVAEAITIKARLEGNVMKPNEVNLKLKPFVEQLK